MPSAAAATQVRTTDLLTVLIFCLAVSIDWKLFWCCFSLWELCIPSQVPTLRVVITCQVVFPFFPSTDAPLQSSNVIQCIPAAFKADSKLVSLMFISNVFLLYFILVKAEMGKLCCIWDRRFISLNSDQGSYTGILQTLFSLTKKKKKTLGSWWFFFFLFISYFPF